ncbi:MAG: hypothetical protein QOK33_4501 [Mycobacterium sp.]|jgi:hypothetical protein|nr:hypothetical protein [Mycobacterium sp.]
MAVFLALILGSLTARLVGWLGVDYVDSWPKAIAVGLAVMFAMTGGAHFAPGLRRDMIAIVPPRLPNPPKSMPTRLGVRSGEEVVYLAAAVVVAVGGG